MWYTIYNEAPISDEIDELYRMLLNHIKTDNWWSLYMLRLTYDQDSPAHMLEELNGYTHEICENSKRQPVLSTNFTKTARKRYDIAVMLSYIAAAIIENTGISWDRYDESIEDLVKYLQEWDVDKAKKGLLHYIKKESIDMYDFQKKADMDRRAREMCALTIHSIEEILSNKEK